MSKISAIFDILKAGNEIREKTILKHGTITVNNIVILLTAIFALLNQFDCVWCNIALSSDQILGISTGIMSILAIFNNISTASTSVHASINPIENIKVLAQGSDSIKLKPVSPELLNEVEKNQ